MQTDLQAKLVSLENLIKIQRDNLARGYMHGMLNGLICAHAVVSNKSPQYERIPSRRVKIRHKMRK